MGLSPTVFGAHGVLDLLHPGSEDSSYFASERGFQDGGDAVRRCNRHAALGCPGLYHRCNCKWNADALILIKAVLLHAAHRPTIMKAASFVQTARPAEHSDMSRLKL